MKLKTKFILAVATIISIFYGFQLHRVAALQNQLVIEQAKEQAKMLHKQVVLTRQWVADHEGLFLIKTDDIAPNPFLDDSSVRADDGQLFIRHNPAMVTRELSDYTSREGFCWFRVTSLTPVNPANKPDDFERRSLMTMRGDRQEIFQIAKKDSGRVLRYIAPLFVEEPCLPCHGKHGYAIGDLRGGLSISIPLAQADKAISANNRQLLTNGILSVLAVSGVLILLFNTLVARRLDRLSTAMKNYPAVRVDEMELPHGNDELGELSRQFHDLCARLDTSQQQLDKAREQSFHNEKMAALGQLTAGIAHEINNPLGGLLNCVKTMRDEPDDLEQHHRYLPLLEQGLNRIANTMRQLLNFGRKEPLQPRRVDVDAVIRECFELLRYRLEKTSLTLDLKLSAPHYIDVDALRQIVVNIGLNAIQAMDNGGALIVSTRLQDERIEIQFTDNGPGIPQNIQHRIFEPFFTTKEVGKGTGLGLAVTHSLTRRMGGAIVVESEPGPGCQFIITLPATSQDSACQPPSNAEA